MTSVNHLCNCKAYISFFHVKVKQGLSDLLRQFIGDLTLPDANRILRHPWTNDRYTMGTYSSPKYVAREADIETLAAPYFPGRSKKSGIFFAGEACSPEYWSSMHGARFSGLKAAEEVADLLAA